MGEDAIGYVDFERQDAAYRAFLGTDGRWSFDPELPPEGWALAERLKLISEDYRGPSDGRFGPRQLHEAAVLLNGTATVHPCDPGPPGTVY